jgi:hypothetical protein
MVAPFAAIVRAELIAARAKHANQVSMHESYAVILEEMDELWDEIKKKSGERSSIKLLGELCQIAAMAQRAAEDNGLIDGPQDELR